MAKVKKTGFGFWKKTVVEHCGKTDTFKGNATVEKKDGAVCVTERRLFTSNSTCYVGSSGENARRSLLPDGKLVGKSKSITVEDVNGEKRKYNSGILSINSMEKHGDQVRVVKNGPFGKKTVDTFDAKNVNAIESEDCKVCKSTNPLYRD